MDIVPNLQADVKRYIQQANYQFHKMNIMQARDIKVSIVIPIYNVSKYLRDCLESCIRQTYRNLEIICVDDGSTDDSGMIAEEYAASDSRFKVIHKVNGGLPSARKTGIETSCGDYIFHLDGDDNIPDTAIEELVNIALKENADIVIGDYNVYGPERTYCDSRISNTFYGDGYLRFILSQGLFNIWSKLIRRELYTSNVIQIPPTISIGEDLVQMIQLAYYAKVCVPCKAPTYNYYIRPSSMSKPSRNVIGSLTDRSIYAVEFVTRFIEPRGDNDILLLLTGYVKRFIYEYMRSPYPTALRYDELRTLVGFTKKYSAKIHSFADIVCLTAAYNLRMAKGIVKLRQLV